VRRLRRQRQRRHRLTAIAGAEYLIRVSEPQLESNTFSLNVSAPIARPAAGGRCAWAA
jgi:hypothetical protein